MGVGHEANFTACSNDAVCFRPSNVFPVASISSIATCRPPFGVQGVGREVKSLALVRRTDAASRKTTRPKGVADSFQVSLYKVEPTLADSGFNLLAKYRARAAL